MRPGDVVALCGDLGAGKTTFARLLIAALSKGAAQDVPSPTFSLVQVYETPRMEVSHFDLYRLAGDADLDELGFEDARRRGLVLVEWPERAPGRLPADRLEIALEEEGGAACAPAEEAPRRVRLVGHGEWEARLERLLALRSLAAQAGFAEARLVYIQGDASVRRYARLTAANGASAVLMDWPPQPDGPPIRDGKPYSRLAHLAENARPFVAIAHALRTVGLSAPAILAQDLARGLLVIEDLGDLVFDRALDDGQSQAELWRAATDVLVALRREGVPSALPVGEGPEYRLPAFDRGAMQIETELLLDWYWPAVKGAGPTEARRREYLELWGPVFDRLLALPKGWVLRDFHSPNLLWLPDRKGLRRVGIIDFQDAVQGPHAFDLVSLLQDARRDVGRELEAQLFDYYCEAVGAVEPGFKRAELAYAYAALGAQRNTKILGIFARLALRDGKRAYLRHVPRIWRYLTADLEHGELRALRGWYDAHFPPEDRARALDI